MWKITDDRENNDGCLIGQRSNRAATANRPEETRCRGCGKVESGAAEDRSSNGAYCPRVSVVLGDVIDIGESD